MEKKTLYLCEVVEITFYVWRRCMNLLEYADKHPHLKKSLEQVMQFLPNLNPCKVAVVAGRVPVDNPNVKGITFMDEGGAEIWFAEDPPEAGIFIHEVIHAAGVADEMDNYICHAFIDFALREKIKPFNAVKIMEVTLNDIECCVQELGLPSIEELFMFVGVIPSDVAETCEDEGMLRLKFKDDVPKDCLLKRILLEIAVGLENPDFLPAYEILAKKILEKIRSTSSN